MNIIVAVDKNWAIGKENKLLVSIPADMKFFRSTTTGKVVVMGRKTLESFPNGLPLKNRINIVITSNKEYEVKGVIIVHSIVRSSQPEQVCRNWQHPLLPLTSVKRILPSGISSAQTYSIY